MIKNSNKFNVKAVPIFFVLYSFLCSNSVFSANQSVNQLTKQNVNKTTEIECPGYFGVLKDPQVEQVKCIELHNGLKIALISNQNLTTSSVALAVGAGFVDGDREFPGLSHFVEHVFLFAGGGESLYRYAFNLGGSNIGQTLSSHTRYGFNIPDDQLAKVSTVLAKAIIRRDYDHKLIRSEVIAVNNEYDLKKGRVGNIIDKKILTQYHIDHKGHALDSKTLIGDKSLLNYGIDKLRKQVIAHLDQYYVANNMMLSVVSGKNLDDLEEMFSSRFDAIPSGKVNNYRQSYSPFSFKNNQFMLTSASKNRNSVNFQFPVPRHLVGDDKQKIGYIASKIEHDKRLQRILKVKGFRFTEKPAVGFHWSGDAYLNFTLEHKHEPEDVLESVFSSRNKIAKKTLRKTTDILSCYFDYLNSSDIKAALNAEFNYENYLGKSLSSLKGQSKLNKLVNLTEYSMFDTGQMASDFSSKTPVDSVLPYVSINNAFITYNERNYKGKEDYRFLERDEDTSCKGNNKFKFNTRFPKRDQSADNYTKIEGSGRGVAVAIFLDKNEKDDAFFINNNLFLTELQENRERIERLLKSEGLKLRWNKHDGNKGNISFYLQEVRPQDNFSGKIDRVISLIKDQLTNNNYPRFVKYKLRSMKAKNYGELPSIKADLRKVRYSLGYYYAATLNSAWMPDSLKSHYKQFDKEYYKAYKNDHYRNAKVNIAYYGDFSKQEKALIQKSARDAFPAVSSATNKSNFYDVSTIAAKPVYVEMDNVNVSAVRNILVVADTDKNYFTLKLLKWVLKEKLLHKIRYEKEVGYITNVNIDADSEHGILTLSQLITSSYLTGEQIQRHLDIANQEIADEIRTFSEGDFETIRGDAISFLQEVDDTEYCLSRILERLPYDANPECGGSAGYDEYLKNLEFDTFIENALDILDRKKQQEWVWVVN